MTNDNNHLMTIKSNANIFFDEQIVTVLSLSSFFIYFPGRSLARSCKSTTTTTTTTNQPTKPTPEYHTQQLTMLCGPNSIKCLRFRNACPRCVVGRALALGGSGMSGGGGAFGSGGGSSSGAGSGGGHHSHSLGQHHHHHPHHHHLHPHHLQQQQQQQQHGSHHNNQSEGESLNIIPLKGGGGSDGINSPGSILGSIMGVGGAGSQQQQTGNGNPAGSPHIVSNTGGRISLPLPLTACHRCDVCGKLLSTKLTLKRHKEQQHLQPLNNAVCNLCHKVFRTLNSLNNHKSIYHRRQKQHHAGNSPGSNGGGNVGGGGGSSGGGGLTSLQQQQQFHMHPSQALNALTASAIAAAIEENAVRTAAASAGAVTPTGISAAKSEFKSEYL